MCERKRVWRFPVDELGVGPSGAIPVKIGGGRKVGGRAAKMFGFPDSSPSLQPEARTVAASSKFNKSRTHRDFAAEADLDFYLNATGNST